MLLRMIGITGANMSYNWVAVPVQFSVRSGSFHISQYLM